MNKFLERSSMKNLKREDWFLISMTVVAFIAITYCINLAHDMKDSEMKAEAQIRQMRGIFGSPVRLVKE